MILNLARRLNIPFRQGTSASKTATVDEQELIYLHEIDEGSANTPETANDDERAERVQRILNFKATKPSSFGDAMEWQKNERNERALPFKKST